MEAFRVRRHVRRRLFCRSHSPCPFHPCLSALVVVCIGVCIGAAALVWLLGSRNPYTPAGYVGYLTKGAVLGKSRFYGIQRGPTSAGRTWLLDVTNISITPYTYTEEFTGNQAVLSRDNLKISFASTRCGASTRPGCRCSWSASAPR